MVLALCISMALLASCHFKPKSWWREAEIAVMADSSDWNTLQGPLSVAFEKVIRTPQDETVFSLRHVESSEFKSYTTYQYLILAATLESKGPIGEIVRKSLDSEIMRGIESGEYYVFSHRDQWAKNQLMMILVAKNLPMLVQKIQANGPSLFALFDRDMDHRLKPDMYRKKEQKDLSNKIMAAYGWTLRIQSDYFIASESSKEGFLWLRRIFPERWLFVRWIDRGDTTALHPQWVIRERNQIGSLYYGGDRIADQYLYSTRSTFLGRECLITEGLWENDGQVKGGPFKNITFFDPASQRVFMIDLAVYAPGRDKLPYLRRMDIMAHTFRTLFDQEENKNE
jgi:hypothetical protein